MRVVGGNRPVADVLTAIVFTQPVRAAAHSDRRAPQLLAGGVKRAKVSHVRQIRQGMIASQAADVLEEDKILAVIAMKDLHDDSELFPRPATLCDIWLRDTIHEGCGQHRPIRRSAVRNEVMHRPCPLSETAADCQLCK